MEQPKPPEDGSFGPSSHLPPQPPIRHIVNTPIPIAGHPLQQNFVVQPTNGGATAGLVFGILSILISAIGGPLSLGLCCFVSIPMAAVGVVFSHIGYSRSKVVGVGNGNAVGGLILNWLQVGLALILIFLLILGISVPLAAG